MKELHVKSLLPVRLDKYLMDQFPALGMGRLNKALRENKIKLNGKKQPLSTRVQNGDIIKLFLNDDQLENRPTPAAVFVYEDDDIIIASKPAGIAVDGPDSARCFAAYKRSWPLRARCPTPAALPPAGHRYKRLVLLAKNSAAEAFLTAAIKARDIEKRYLCVTFGRPNPPAALLRDYLLKDAERGIVRITDTTAGGAKEVITGYETLAVSGRLGPVGGRACDRAHPSDPRAFSTHRLPDSGRFQVRQQRRQPRAAVQVSGALRVGAALSCANQRPSVCASRRAGIPRREAVVLPADSGRYAEVKALGRADTEFVPTKKAVPSAWKALLFLYALASSARLRLRRYSRAAVRMASDDTSVMSQFSVNPAIR